MSGRGGHDADGRCAVILEGLVTTTDGEGGCHLAAMGPIVEPPITRLVLRPFVSSTTFAHLSARREGVFHVTDDVELLARTAIGLREPLPRVVRAVGVEGWILADACRWYAFQVESIAVEGPRSRMQAAVVDAGRQRDFLGFNRAQGAVVEGAILATRIGILPADEIQAEMARLAVRVAKTAGPPEERAWRLLADFVARELYAAGERPIDAGSGGRR